MCRCMAVKLSWPCIEKGGERGGWGGGYVVGAREGKEGFKGKTSF